MAKVLVALAEERVLSYLADGLANEGFDTRRANSLEGVLECLADERFDAVVADIFQPVIDGVALFATIARSSPKTKIVALMDFQSARARSYEINLWVDSIIVKPFAVERIRKELSFVLAGEQPVEAPVSA